MALPSFVPLRPPRCRPAAGRRTSPLPGRCPLLLLVALAFLAPPGTAQVPGFQATVGGGVETYRFSQSEAVGVRSITLTTLPFQGRVSLGPRVAVRMAGAHASGRLVRGDGTSHSLTGVTDTELRVEGRFGRDRATLSGIVQLPTGKSGYTPGEAEVAGIVAADVLPFRITDWGSGGGAGLHASATHAVARFAVGGALGYMVSREFDALEGGNFTYRPGNQLLLRVAADHSVGQAGKLALQLSAWRYGTDELGGANLYRAGDRYQALLSYAFAAPGYSSAMIYGGFLRRGEGASLGSASLPPTGNDAAFASRTLFLAGARARVPAGGAVLIPTADLRVQRSGDGVGQGYTTTVGSSAEWPVGSALLLPTIRARFGRVISFQDARSGFSGIDIGLSARLGASRP